MTKEQMEEEVLKELKWWRNEGIECDENECVVCGERLEGKTSYFVKYGNICEECYEYLKAKE